MRRSDFMTRLKSHVNPKRFSTVVAACSLAALALLTPTRANAQEILYNPGYELGSPGWYPLTWGGSVGSNTDITSAGNFHGGSHAQQVAVTSLPAGSGYVYKQDYTLTAGKIYRASIWIKAVTTGKVKFYVRRSNAYYDSAATRTVDLNPADGWKQYVIYGGSATTEGFFVGINFLTPATLIVDDASLTDVTSTHSFSNNVGLNNDIIPKSFFGVHFNKSIGNIWPALGHGTVRLWDTGTMWMNQEPSQGNWQFQHTWDFVNGIHTSDPNAQIIMTLGGTPQWAAEDPNSGGAAYGPGSNSPPLSEWDFNDYVANVIGNNVGSFNYLELWNETNEPNFMNAAANYFVEYARLARAQINTRQPSLKLIAPNITIHGIDWLEDFLHDGGDQYVDAYSVHAYNVANGDPENAAMTIINLRELLASYGINKPILNDEARTEFGFTPTDSQSRAAVARQFLTSRAAGAVNMTWYAWDINDPTYANLSQNYTTTALAAGGVAYGEVAKWLTGAQMTYCSVDPNQLWTIGITRGQNYSGTIVWKQSGGVTYSITPSWGIVRRRNLDGTSSSLVGQSTTYVGTEPVLLENSTNPLMSAKVNFQPAAAPVPSGYLVDSGTTYSQKGNLWYGWNATNSTAVDCNITTPQEKDTLIVSQGKTWEFNVPAGKYTVRIVAGDPRYYNETFKVNAEGVVVINGTTSSTAGTHYIDNTVSNITCTDGKLTVTNAAGSTNNKLCFIVITQTQQL